MLNNMKLKIPFALMHKLYLVFVNLSPVHSSKSVCVCVCVFGCEIHLCSLQKQN